MSALWLELRTLLRRPSSLAMLAVSAAVPAMYIATVLARGGAGAISRATLDDALRAVTFAGTLAAVAGALVTGGEFRHRTVARALLTRPRRERLVAVKLAEGAAVGVVFAVVTAAVLVAMLASHRGGFAPGVSLLDGRSVTLVAGAVAASALWGAAGAALGLVMRSDVGAVVAALGWLLVIEPLAHALQPGLSQVLPGYVANAFVASAETLPPVSGICIFVSYVGLAALFAAKRWRDLDVI